jgi:hypothetical protein
MGATTDTEPAAAADTVDGRLLPNQSAHALWLEAEDARGRRYYFHKFTMRTQWAAPAAFTPQRWFSRRDTHGRLYYFRPLPCAPGRGEDVDEEGEADEEEAPVEVVWSLPADAQVIEEKASSSSASASASSASTSSASVSASSSVSAAAAAAAASSSSKEEHEQVPMDTEREESTATGEMSISSTTPPSTSASAITSAGGDEKEVSLRSEAESDPLPAYW